MNNDDLLSQIDVMHTQECGVYACRYYLGLELVNSTDCVFRKRMLRRAQLRNDASFGPSISAPIDVECRFKMSRWCYQVVDHCGFDRECVSVAMSYLDRFLATDVGEEAFLNRKTYQLVVMTTLYIAIKITSRERMSPSFVTTVSGGNFTEEDITDMETIILGALEWRMQPPTPLSFIRHFLHLVPPESVSSTVLNFIFEISRLQVELAVTNYSLITIKPSTIAVASILNTMDFMDEKCLPDDLRRALTRILDTNGAVYIWGEEMWDLKNKLMNEIAKNPTHQVQGIAAHMISTTMKSKRANENLGMSPKSVDHEFHIVFDNYVSSISGPLQGEDGFAEYS